MPWLGRWRNQYGSVLDITREDGGRIEGTFRTALEDSSFYGQTVPVSGIAHGDVIGVTAAGEGTAGPAAVSYTGILRDGKLETMWLTVAGSTITGKEGEIASRKQVGTWRAFGTSLDTFVRE
ncbi:hypothetical protein EOA23_29225 [Mesorhizobium sp. M2A.F.Ca.ET.042.01.1.1]|uniref:avidin/streptavidin family protein n=1 Tax=Mesorhizobium sp. M2A.F.Ca.ET.042.01.1.1 TaxID=2496745 RepID=UPI000FCB30BE|nr:avidin/streptavidin family protein [Mesorhizobium sp. M2A.F.Ca.ET.042.01.1.1]RUX20062.1 hypothetical protein EOA23_29225 [Mesorhizobium sp. M2A.F.Ca.ET.042.01.1.1]